MAGKLILYEEVEVNCPPKQVLEMFRGKQHEIPNICPDKIPSVEAHHDDWTSVGDTTRRWDYVHDGKAQHLIEKIEEVDEEKNIIVISVIDGEVMQKYYKTFKGKIEAIPTAQGCLVKWTMEYEKLTEDAPPPQHEMDFIVGLLKHLGDHHAKNNA